MIVLAILLFLILLSLLFFYQQDRLLFYAILIGVLARFAVFAMEMTGIWAPPGCCADAFRFQSLASTLSGSSWMEIAEHLGTGTWAYVSMTAALMKVADVHDRVFMIWVNMVLGVWVLGLTALIAKQMWGRRVAFLITLITALYPFAIFNSVTALREEPAIFSFLLGLLMFLGWLRSGGIGKLLLAIAGFGIATFFHPGFIAAFVGIAGYLIVENRQVLGGLLRASRVPKKGFQNILGGTVLLVAIVGAVVSGYAPLGERMDVSERELGEIVAGGFAREEAIGGSAYPAFMVHGDPFRQPWLIPARMIYLLYVPFPWDIRSPAHLLGVVSPILYFFLTFHIVKNIRILSRRPETVALLCMFIAFTFIFSIGVTNVGTGIRHKTKFLILPLLLAGAGLQKSRLLRIARLFDRGKSGGAEVPANRVSFGQGMNRANPR